MKRCPECRRDYTDETLNFCLDDGTALLDGPASLDESATAILSDPSVSTGAQFADAPTRAQIQTTYQTFTFPTGTEPTSKQSDFGLTDKHSFFANSAAKLLVGFVVSV